MFGKQIIKTDLIRQCTPWRKMGGNVPKRWARQGIGGLRDPKGFSMAGLQCGWVECGRTRKGGRLGPLCFGDYKPGPWDQMTWFKFQPCYLLIRYWTNDSHCHVLVSLSIKMEIVTVSVLGGWVNWVNKHREVSGPWGSVMSVCYSSFSYVWLHTCDCLTCARVHLQSIPVIHLGLCVGVWKDTESPQDQWTPGRWGQVFLSILGKKALWGEMESWWSLARLGNIPYQWVTIMALLKSLPWLLILSSLHSFIDSFSQSTFLRAPIMQQIQPLRTFALELGFV